MNMGAYMAHRMYPGAKMFVDNRNLDEQLLLDITGEKK